MVELVVGSEGLYSDKVDFPLINEIERQQVVDTDAFVDIIASNGMTSPDNDSV